MTEGFRKSPGLDLFVFESSQLLEQLERLLLDGEKMGGLATAIDEVFRIMHTIKGSAAMMLFDNIAALAHSLEDVFYYLRESKPQNVDYCSLTDMVLHAVDFIKNDVAAVENGYNPHGNPAKLIDEIGIFLAELKRRSPNDGCGLQGKPEQTKQRYCISPRRGDQAKSRCYEARVFFDEACEMENVRAFMLIQELKEITDDVQYFPPNVLEDDSTAETIRQEGFKVCFSTQAPAENIQACFEQTMFMKSLEFHELVSPQQDSETSGGDGAINEDDGSGCSLVKGGIPDKEVISLRETGGDRQKPRTISLEGPLPDESFRHDPDATEAEGKRENAVTAAVPAKQQRFISVNVGKMDMLMDLVGELVIAEAMVTQHPELKGLPLDSFFKAARQLRKITNELQDVVMSVRMVPLTTTFQKMSRIVRDMTKKLKKQAELETAGDETEVDKNIIEHISDPLMHLIRNALDHGIESAEERIAKGKDPVGKIRLEAKNAGGDVWIIVQDDGGGLDKEKIFQKALERGLVHKNDQTLTDKEIYAFISHPGFSTKENVSEFSGRGVGMDVVARNIEKVGGTLSIDSRAGGGTTISVRIPLTLAIIDGMNVQVGNALYTIPIIAVKEAFSLQEHHVISDTDGSEMILLRGQCHPVLRLYERYRVKCAVTDLRKGVMLMVEADGKGLCLFVDALLGQQQIVVKALPKYIKKTRGISGCTLLGDGNVSLVLDVAGLIQD